MDPRINILTLGVRDIERSKTFYEKLGFKAASVSNEHFVAFQLQSLLLCLYPLKLLEEDVKVTSTAEGFRGMTLAYNVASKQEVQQILDHAKKSGAKLLKAAQEVFWGGVSGYFADPDGHVWEVAWNPHWLLGKDGMLQLPES